MNFYKFLECQKQEDRQAFIVHYPPASGKTRFARHLCQGDPSLYYVDLLAVYLAAPGMPAVTDLNPRQFQKWLLGLACPPEAHTLILDHGDFLFNTWNADEKGQFLSWLRVTLRTPSPTTRTHVFFIQTDGILSSAQLTNSHGTSRILKLSEFETI